MRSFFPATTAGFGNPSWRGQPGPLSREKGGGKGGKDASTHGLGFPSTSAASGTTPAAEAARHRLGETRAKKKEDGGTRGRGVHSRSWFAGSGGSFGYSVSSWYSAWASEEKASRRTRGEETWKFRTGP